MSGSLAIGGPINEIMVVEVRIKKLDLKLCMEEDESSTQRVLVMVAKLDFSFFSLNSNLTLTVTAFKSLIFPRISILFFKC